MSDFRARYGPWAVIAGGSEGLGAAFASALAARSVNLVLIADGAEALERCSREIAERHGVEVRHVVIDLRDPGFAGAVADCMGDIEVGLGIYNAAFSFIAPLFERPLADALRVIDVNCAGPIRFAHLLIPPMIARARGGLVLVSSLAGMQGTPRLSAYAASKAFNIVLAESLWAELAPLGVDVLVSCCGAIRTPGYQKVSRREAPGTLDAAVVAERTLAALGRGPRVIPGAVNKLASFLMARLLPRKSAVAMMQKSTRGLE